MTYIQGFLTPAKTAAKDAYVAMSAKMAPILADYGALRIVEAWGDNIADGKRTDMKRAVAATPDETVVFSWIVWPDKATADAASEKMRDDERLQPDGEMPFDMTRLVYGGFDPVFETGAKAPIGYVDGMVASVGEGKRDAFLLHAKAMGDLLIEYGANRVVDGWGVDVPAGKVTDFPRAVQAGDGETMVFGWVEWPDKHVRDEAWQVGMGDQRMHEVPAAWNGPLAIFGGFTPVFDSDRN